MMSLKPRNSEPVMKESIHVETSGRFPNPKISDLRVEELKLHEWNGYVELTDECCFGLALFELRSEHLYTKITVPLKDMEVERGVRIVLMNNLQKTQIALTSGSQVTIPLPYIDVFADMGVVQFIHETKMVGKLMTDIKEIKSVRDRWLPNFIGNLSEIESVLNAPVHFRVPKPEMLGSSLFAYSPKTIGQYLLLAMCERLRKRVKKGLSLKTMIYLLSLITRFAKDGNYESLSLLLHNAVVWITQSTCDDCLIKTMRYLHGQKSFEYSYHLSDSFSQYIKFQAANTINMSISSQCPLDGTVTMTDEQKRCFLRTMGTHAFLISPNANKRISVLIRYSDDFPENRIFPTGRELVSLLSVMDLHARVLRAHDWNQSVSAFNAWWSERCTDLTTNSNELLSYMIDDLINLRKQSRVMQACTTHLICLLTRGVIQRELIFGYNSRQSGERAHEFLIRHVFYVAPSTTMAAFAEMYYKRFEKMSPDERRLEISFTLENSKHSYALCPIGTLGPMSRKLKITRKERVLYINEAIETTASIEKNNNLKIENVHITGDEDCSDSVMDCDLEPLPMNWNTNEDAQEENREEQRCGEELVEKVISSLQLRRADKAEDDPPPIVVASTSTEYKDIEPAKENQALPSLPDVHFDWNEIIDEEERSKNACSLLRNEKGKEAASSDSPSGLTLDEHMYNDAPYFK